MKSQRRLNTTGSVKSRCHHKASSLRLMTSIGVLALMQALSGCVTTQAQPDGSTKVRLSVGTSTKPAQAAAPDNFERQDRAALPSVRTTPLAGVFSKHPYDGTNKTHFPRVAVTVTDWVRNDCWSATATIWWSMSKSEAVPSFSVCRGQSLGYAVNNAANLHLFMQQTAIEHSGNVRTSGPKPPMLAIPDRQPISERQQLAFQGFIQQLVRDTGWQPGAPTNLWLVGYGASATVQPWGSKAKIQLEQALSCASITQRFDQAEAALRLSGWSPDQGITPVTLPEPLRIHGLTVRKVAVSRDGGEHVYRSFMPGVSWQEVVKAAALKLGKDGKTYGRLTKVGVLSADMEGGDPTLTCTVNTEGAEG
ncbi:MAG: hypothetical protein HY836_12855 [Aquabacterium sp.]|nr:hypothetical protein [Aquabacterium sp.]